MTKNNVRIAIRDSTDSHNVAFFDNQAGIKYKSANLQRFLAGSASILTFKYNSKDIDSIRSGCKLAFRYKARDYWLNVMNFEKKGYEVELTAYSLGLELNNETRGEHKPANAMSIAEYVAYYDPERALTIGVNEVSDKRIKLEWTGTDTILARLFSVANSFDAELDFSVELNDDYSLKRQVLNIYKKGNLGTNKTSSPVRVGKELKVINYSDNIKELKTAVRATGKDGLTIDGLNKKIYDDNKQLLYYSNADTVYAPQSRDRFPSVGKGSNDNWIIEDLGETQYETKEALWAYLYSEIQKKSLPEITYDVEGAIDAGIGDTQILIDDIHFEPALYVQARVSELEDDILTGKVTKSTFINFERKSSQVSNDLLKRVEQLAAEAMPYTLTLTTNNGIVFKNGQGNSTITPTLKRGLETISDVRYIWEIGGNQREAATYSVNAFSVKPKLTVNVDALVNDAVVAQGSVTFVNVDDGTAGAATFVQETAPANPPEGSRWKYTGNDEITASGSEIKPDGQYLFFGDKWVQDTIASENLEIKDQFIGNSMIADGAVTVDKLSVNNLAAISADLGKVTAGNILLQRAFNAGELLSYSYPAYKTGLFMDNYGLLVNGGPTQKTPSETTASDMPVVAVTSGEIRFLRADLTDNLEQMLHEGLADPDFGYMQFGRDNEGRNALIVQSSGQVYLKGENYTDWAVSTVNDKVRWKIQGNLVIVNYDVTFSSEGSKHIVTIPPKYIPSALMLPVKAWNSFNDKDKNAQLNDDGSLYILGVDANQLYRGQIVWAY